MLLAVAALSLFQGLDQKITFTDPGKPVPQLVEEISAAAHVPLSAPKSFQTDIITVRVRDTSLKDLLDRIATLAAGDWQEKNGGYELIRSREKLQAQERAEFDREVSMFQKGIDKQKKTLESLEPWNDQTARGLALAISDLSKSRPNGNSIDIKSWRTMQTLDARAPSGRSITRVVAALDARELANLPMGYRVVFSDQPTRLQRPLPHGVALALKDLVAEQNIWADVAGRFLSEPQGGIYSSATWMKKPFDGQLGKVLLCIFKSKNGGGLTANIELLGADRNGAIITRANQSLNTFDSGESLNIARPMEGDKPIQPNEAEEALSQLFSANRVGGGLPRLSKGLFEAFQNPERNEPLSLMSGDILVKIAESRNCNLIADQPDESFLVGAMVGTHKMTPSAFLQSCSTYVDISQADGWMTLSSKTPASSRTNRMDRATLGAFLRIVATKGASLDDMAAYAVAVKGDLYASPGFMLSSFLSSKQQYGYHDPLMLRFYGLLDSSQRNALAKGAGLPIASLSPAETEQLNQMIFGQNSNLSPKPRQNQSTESSRLEAFYNGIAREPTELFGGGIPRESVLTFEQQSDRVLISPPYQGNGGMTYGNGAMGPDEVAQRLYAQERPGVFPWLDGAAPFSHMKFLFGSRTNMTFTFDFGNLASLTTQLQDTSPDAQDLVPYDQVPLDFRNAVENRLVDMRKQYASLKPGQFYPQPSGPTKPPPPTPNPKRL